MFCNNHSIFLEVIGFFVHFPRYETRWEKIAQEQSAVFLGDCAAEMATEVDRYDFGDFGFAKVIPTSIVPRCSYGLCAYLEQRELFSPSGNTIFRLSHLDKHRCKIICCTFKNVISIADCSRLSIRRLRRP